MTLPSDNEQTLQNVALPFGCFNPALEDDEEGRVLSHDFSNSSELISPSSIHIENSTDVIVGPVTQFHGPVTIYQNVNGPEPEALQYNNGKLGKSDSTSSEPSYPVAKQRRFCPIENKCLQYGSIPIVCLIIVSIVTVAVVTRTNNSPTNHANNENDSSDYEKVSVGAGLLISRGQWRALPPKQDLRRLQHPTQLVILAHTASGFCSTYQECSEKVRTIQAYHLNHPTADFADIAYNFLIGGDSNVYVGRGWEYTNSEKRNSIVISFIGNFIINNLSPKMINTTQALLALGVERGDLAENYKLVCHNQTFATESPGRNVYKIVKNWPHFSNETIF